VRMRVRAAQRSTGYRVSLHVSRASATRWRARSNRVACTLGREPSIYNSPHTPGCHISNPPHTATSPTLLTALLLTSLALIPRPYSPYHSLNSACRCMYVCVLRRCMCVMVRPQLVNSSRPCRSFSKVASSRRALTYHPYPHHPNPHHPYPHPILTIPNPHRVPSPPDHPFHHRRTWLPSPPDRPFPHRRTLLRRSSFRRRHRLPKQRLRRRRRWPRSEQQ
jgi:hypothetical protein